MTRLLYPGTRDSTSLERLSEMKVGKRLLDLWRLVGALDSRDDGLHTVRELVQPRSGKQVAPCGNLDARWKNSFNSWRITRRYHWLVFFSLTFLPVHKLLHCFSSIIFALIKLCSRRNTSRRGPKKHKNALSVDVLLIHCDSRPNIPLSSDEFSSGRVFSAESGSRRSG